MTSLTNPVEDVLKSFLKQKENYDSQAEKGPFGYMEHFAKLRQKSLEYRDEEYFSCNEGTKSYNIRKNRYKDIIPFDYTRVKLSKFNEMPGSDYINANYIEGPLHPKQYIAAQGPLPNTVKDFWRMMWEEKTKVVLMACAEYEGIPEKHRCERYWPCSLDDKMVFGQISVSLEKEIHTEFPDYVIREMRVECSRKVQKVHQLHYVGWPDHGVPDDVSTILDMITKSHYHQTDDSVPLVIHCSAGCGRTGTLIVIDYVYSMLKSGKLNSEFDLFDIIDNIRKQRPSMVQSVDQYRFTYTAVAELFLRHLAMVQQHPYENVELLKPLNKKKVSVNSGSASPEKSPQEREKPKTKPPKPKVEERPKKVVPAEIQTSPIRMSCIPSLPIQGMIAKFDQGSQPEKCKAQTDFEQRKKLSVKQFTDIKGSKQMFDSYSTVTETNYSLDVKSKSVTVTDPYSTATFDDSDIEKSEMNSQSDCSSDEPAGDDSRYAYADPLAKDKWALQQYALSGASSIGSTDASEGYAYVSVTSDNKVMTGEYVEVDLNKIEEEEEIDESEDEILEDGDAPQVPSKDLLKSEESSSAKKLPLQRMIGNVLARKNNLQNETKEIWTFPKKIGKPKGPRQQNSKRSPKQ